MAINDLREQVEQRLQDAQKNKTFKDVGRVANLRKTSAAYKLIDTSILSEIEADEVQAFNLVKKDMVWQAIDINAERERGVTAGAAWLKTKIREAVPTKPDNSKKKRESYVLFLTKLQADLLNCFSVNDIEQLAEKYRKFSVTDIIGYVIDSTFLSKDAEQRQVVEDTIKKGYRIAMIYGASRLMKQVIEEVFSKRFHNMLFKSGDTAYITYREALEKEPVSEETADALKTKLIGRKQLFIETNEAKIVEYTNYSVEQLKSKMNTDWQLSSHSKAAYKDNIELFRQWAIDYYKRQIGRGISEYDVKIKDAVAKDNDWSWFEAPKEKGERVVDKTKLTINKKEPLHYIKRTGGYAIGEISPAQLIENFGYKAVNYGNYVDDKWSKQHTKFFLQAMSDLGEIYNINIKELNQLGGLSIVFGGKGKKGHLATYFPQSKDINLTKANGDGSVCHEYGHYFDNVVVELAEKRPVPSLASEKIGEIKDEELKQAYSKLINFFQKGDPNITPKLKVKFLAKDSVSAPSYSKYVNYSWQPVEVKIKSTIEETIAEHKDILILSDKYYATQLRVIGYIIAKFGLEDYEVDLKLNTSMYYQKSAYDYFTYCYLTPTKWDINKMETKMGVQRRTPYWTSEAEMFARAWETVMLKKLIEKGRRSDYLVSGIDLSDLNVEGFQNPYPSGVELDYIEELFENIITATKKAYNLSDFVPFINEREDTLVEFESKKKPVIESGVDVVKTETKEVVEFVKENKVTEVVVEDKQELDIKDNDIKVGLKIIQKKWGGNSYKITKILPNNKAYTKADVRGNYVGNSTYIRTFDEIKNNYIKLIKDDSGKVLGFDYKNQCLNSEKSVDLKNWAVEINKNTKTEKSGQIFKVLAEKTIDEFTYSWFISISSKDRTYKFDGLIRERKVKNSGTETEDFIYEKPKEQSEIPTEIVSQIENYLVENNYIDKITNDSKTTEDKKEIQNGTGEEFVGKTFQIFQTLVDRKGKPQDFSDVSKMTSLSDGKLSYKTDNGGAGFISVKSFYDKLNNGQAIEVQSETKESNNDQVNEAIELITDLLDSDSEETKLNAKEAIELLKDLL